MQCVRPYQPSADSDFCQARAAPGLGSAGGGRRLGEVREREGRVQEMEDMVDGRGQRCQ